MLPEKIIIIDDLPAEKLLSNILAKSQYKKAHIKRVLKLDAIKQELKVPRDTVVLINAHVKFENSDLRCYFKGLQFLITQLRTYWERKEGVLIYSPLSQDAFLSIPIAKWLIKDIPCCRYHKYIRIPYELFKIPNLIKEVQVISEEELESCSAWESIIKCKLRIWRWHSIPTALEKRIIEQEHIEKTKHLCEDLLSIPLYIQSKIGIKDLLGAYEGLGSNPYETIRKMAKIVDIIFTECLLERR
jgi:hypothetical protein